jgi:hypothetical protein
LQIAGAFQETEGYQFDKYYSAPKQYVPLIMVCRDKHRETADPVMIKVISNIHGVRNINTIQSSIKRPFPYHHYQCQIINRYGALPPMIPTIYDNTWSHGTDYISHRERWLLHFNVLVI